MGLAQSAFDNAVKHYNVAIDHLETIGSAVSSVKPDYSLNEAKRQFDIILQTILVRAATADSLFEQVEASFIDKITDYGDVLNWINQKFGTTFEWDKFYMLKESDVDHFFDLLDSELVKLAVDFCVPLAIADVVIEFDYYEAFSNSLVGILGSFAYVDADINSEPEKWALAKNMAKYFADPYTSALELANKALSKMK